MKALGRASKKSICFKMLQTLSRMLIIKELGGAFHKGFIGVSKSFHTFQNCFEHAGTEGGREQGAAWQIADIADRK